MSAACCELQNGLCDFCLTYVPVTDNRPAMESATHQALARRSDRPGYDAALLLSGGKDSAYVLHRLRAECHDLRILCIVIDNGFMSPTAIENARRCSDVTGTDLLIVTSERLFIRQALRDAFLSLDERGCYGVIDHADGAAIFNAGERAATELGIPLLICGLSWVQLQMIAAPPDLQIVCPLASWRTDEREIRRYVRGHELLVDGSDSPLISNSRLVPVMGLLDVMNLGYSSFEPEFAQLVREGKADRDYWRNVFDFLNFAVARGLLRKEVEVTLAELDLTIDQLI